MELDLKMFVANELGFTPIKLAIVGVLWLFVFVAMVIDLHFGLRKARRAGIATKSELLKRTTTKVSKNYSALTFMLMFDVFFFWVTSYVGASQLSYFPLPSIAMAAFEIWVEYKSYREKLNEKMRSEELAALNDLIKLYQVIKEDDPKKLIETVRENIKKKEHETN